MSKFEKEFLENVQRRFAEHIKENPDYVVKQMHRDGDTVELWRCGRPELFECSFYICSAPHCLMVYGDMGEYMWQRHREMIPFVRGSAGSLDYFSEKVPRDIQIKTEYPELVREWLDTVKQERIDYGCGWGEKEEKALLDLRDAWSWSDSIEEWKSSVYKSELYRDYEDVPCTEFYTFHYLWTVEALKWFIEQLDTGKVQVQETAA